MLKQLQLFLLISWIPVMAYSQLPTYHSGTPASNAPGTGSVYPFGVNATGARFQTYYNSGAFGNNLPSIVPITRLYFYADTIVADTLTYSNIIINLGEYVTAPGIGLTSAWLPTPNNLTPVLNATNLKIVMDSGWFSIDLQTPFLYTSSNALFIDVAVASQSPYVKQWRVRTGPGGAGYKAAGSQFAGAPNSTTIGSASVPAMGFDIVTGTDNASLAKIILPSVCGTSQDAVVKLTNSGTNVINTVTIDWSINGILQSPIMFTGPLDTVGSGNNDTLITLGSVNFSSGPQIIKAWTSQPNSNQDAFTLNDTITFMMSSSLNGTYTIGAAGAYTSIPGAIDALYLFGVCGPVTFIIDSTTYFDQISMTGRINGASALNPVVFQGIDKTKTILSWAALAVDSKHVIKLRNVAYVTFRDLTVKPTGATNAWGFHLQDSCYGVSIRNCLIDLSSAATSTGADNTVGIAITGPSTSTCIPGPCAAPINQPSRADSLHIDSNTILYGYQGVTITGNTGLNKGRYNQVTNNLILYSYQRAINLTQQENVIVSNNKIVPRASGVAAMGTGIFCTGVSSPANTQQTVISNNKIYGYGAAGISINTSVNAEASNKGLIINNMIGGSEQLADANAIYMIDSKNWSVAHNSINRDFINTTSATSSGIRLLGTSGSISILNNLIAVTKPGEALPFHAVAASNIDSMDRNLFYRSNAANDVLHIGGTTYQLNNFKGGSGFNLNSTVTPVLFRNDTNLYNQSICGFPTATPLPYVPNDINNAVRSTVAPVVGASEDAATQNNIALIKISNPVSPINPGTTTMRLLVQNLGSNPISFVTVNYQLNNQGLTSQVISFTPALSVCDTITISLPGFTFLSIDTINTLQVYTSMPNGLSDSYQANDSISLKLYAPLGGTYTVGGPGADFITFAEATSALRSAGIRSSVKFEVNPGNYNEQVTISGPVNGLSATNNITFDGIDNNTRSVSFAGNNAAPHTIKVDNVKYVSIRNLTVMTLGSTTGTGIHLSGNANGCRIKNCIITIGGSGATNTSNAFNPITLSGSAITTSARIDSVEIDSNVINGGYYGINAYAGSGAANVGQFNKFRYNNIQTPQQYGIYLYYQQTPEVTGNTIKCRGANGGVGIFCQNVTTPAASQYVTTISHNRISDYGGAGISMSGCTNPNALLKGRIVNNVIGGNEKAIGGNGILLNTSTFWAICNNTVNRDINGTSNINAAALRIQGTATTSTGNSVINNVLSVYGSGSALPLHTQVAGNTDTINYNLFYKADTLTSNVLLYTGSNVTLNNFKTGTFNKNSLFYKPGFVSTTDLSPNLNDSSVWSMNGRALHSAYARTDFNNSNRPLNIMNGVPDIGAYEFTPIAIPPAATAIPDTIIGGTMQTFMFATDTVARIAWPLANNGQATVKIRQYSGERGPGFDTLLNHMYFYLGITTFPFGIDSIMVYYNELWKGTHLTENNIKFIHSDTGSQFWQNAPISTVNTVRNIISYPYFYTGANYTYLSGSDGGVVVPVKLISFNGKENNKNIDLKWLTAGEKNASHFIIEKSTDQRNWKRLDAVKAKGNSSQVVDYGYSDKMAFVNSSIVYYRLKSVDIDGYSDYSPVISFKEDESVEGSVIVYPNPFGSSVNVAFNLPSAEKAEVVIYDLAGKSVYQNTFIIDEQNKILSIDQLSMMQPGIYFISINAGNNTIVKKLVKN